MTKFMTVKMGLVLWFSCRTIKIIKPLNTDSWCFSCVIFVGSFWILEQQSVWRIWPLEGRLVFKISPCGCRTRRRWAPRSSRNMISTLKGLRSRDRRVVDFFGWNRVGPKHFPYEGLIHPIALDLCAAKNLSNMNILESFCMTFQLRKMIKRAQKVCW